MKMFDKKQKKGMAALNILGVAAIGFVVFAVILAVGTSMLTTLQGTQTTNSVAYNNTGLIVTAMGTFATFAGIIALIIILVVVIMLLRGAGQSVQ